VPIFLSLSPEETYSEGPFTNFWPVDQIHSYPLKNSKTVESGITLLKPFRFPKEHPTANSFGSIEGSFAEASGCGYYQP
jgi:hypothetical protein